MTGQTMPTQVLLRLFPLLHWYLPMAKGFFIASHINPPPMFGSATVAMNAQAGTDKLVGVLETLWHNEELITAVSCPCPVPCTKALCPLSDRFGRLQSFLHSRLDLISDPKLRCTTLQEADRVISELRRSPDITKTELKTSTKSTEISVYLAVQIMTMTDCSIESFDSPSKLERGGFRRPWGEDIKFSVFVERIFPYTDHEVLSHPENDKYEDYKTALKVIKLKKKLNGVTLRPTDDLRDHLKFDRKNNVMEFFHHVAFLKEQLRRTREVPDPNDTSECIRR
jgi:hypothetical protein